MILSADVRITLVPMYKLLEVPHVFCEIFPDFFNLLIEVLRKVFYFGVEAFNNSLFVQFVI